MGVKGLQTFVNLHCPASLQEIVISDLAAQHPCTHGQQPILVIDGMAFINKLHTYYNIDWIYGGQWRQLVEHIKSFIKKLSQYNIKTVLFFDGPPVQEKRKEWCERRLKKIVDIKNMFSKLSSFDFSKNFFSPAAMGTFLRYIFKFECNCEVYSSFIEADQEIAQFAASRKECFAILSQDSDFYIYNTKPYLSIQDLDLETLRTKMFVQKIFANKLQIHRNLLPLMSCLSGNDIVPKEWLRAFHQEICHSRSPRGESIFPNICRVIKQYRWTGDFSNENEMQHISNVVFRNGQHGGLLADGIRSYSLQVQAKPTSTSPFHQVVVGRHRDCTNLPTIYTVLEWQQFDSSEVMESVEESGFPIGVFYRPVRQKIYSLILYPNQPVYEWCAFDGNPLQQPEVVYSSEPGRYGEFFHT
ncbi:FAM120B [Cordylochernes scorpioides]|uniref:FAM120B n=1 Tax=Cordylochernes scorpioides TaxID=51811 RepID=A0ABY6LHD7_9ARAC|nr:FAM120B [Cordylochernes scorpioides]